MDRSTRRIVGSLFIALCAGLSDEGVRFATDVLRDLSENPHIRPEERQIYRSIAYSASAPFEVLGAENEESERCFEVITGGGT